MNVSENLEIWTAGACYPDGTGSWGWIARAGERELKRSGLIASTTTCNRAEMSAVLKAMASLHGQKDQLLFKNVTIYTANSYAVGAFSKWTVRKNTKNQDLIAQYALLHMDLQQAGCNIGIQWVKSGIGGVVDSARALATEARWSTGTVAA